jgi:ribose-phosphate pyrophosphokinase
LVVVLYSRESEKLGTRLAEELKIRRMTIESKTFPDGESYLRFTEQVTGQDLIVVQSCYPLQDKRLIELFFTLDTAKELGAKTIIAVIPYLPYSRQDKRFRVGEVLSNTTVGKLLKSASADLLVTVDVHQKELLNSYAMRTINVTAMPLIADYLKKLKLSHPFILAPDKGAAANARRVASILGADYDCFEKRRDTVTGQIETSERCLDLVGRDVVILDDMISTGKTIVNVSRIAAKSGAGRIIAACTHALLVGDAEVKMKEGGVTDIVGTDTVDSFASRISVAPAIAESLRQFL